MCLREIYCSLQTKGKKVSTCEEAAGTVGSMATCNAPNQEAFRLAGALPLLLELVLTAERSIKASLANPAECPCCYSCMSRR